MKAETPARTPAAARRRDIGGAWWVVSYLALVLAWMLLLNVAIGVWVVARLIAETGFDAEALQVAAARLGADPASAIPGTLLVVAMVVQFAGMAALLPLASRVVAASWYGPASAPRRPGRAPGMGEGWPPERLDGVVFAAAIGVGLTVGHFPGWIAEQAREVLPSMPGGALELVGPLLLEGPLWQRAAAALLIGVAGPVVEELVFRGYLWAALARFASPVATLAVTTLVFAGFHLDPVHVVAVVPTGLVLGVLRAATGGLTAPILAHVVNNTAAVLLTLAVAGDDTTALPAPAAFGLFGVALGLAALVAARGPTVGSPAGSRAAAA